MACTILHGDSLELLKTLPNCSVDSIVTDPPYELGFMGKSWDATGIAYNVELWTECLRVLKPGGHLLAFGGTRTYHRMACAIEDAGFEIRDSIHWIYGSGFPKSLDVSKAIDKQAGAERERVPYIGGIASGSNNYGGNSTVHVGTKVGPVPITDAAKQWEGWGTALKPAHEPIVLARKPFDGTVAANVLQHGTGALNIDATRIAATDKAPRPSVGYGRKDTDAAYRIAGNPNFNTTGIDRHPEGRWPANVILDDTIDEDWARYFYCAKPSKRERNAGLEGLPEQRESDRKSSDKPGGDNPRNRSNAAKVNHHPTVKPLELMRYLVRLVTPPGGTVLEPFAGSGTTLMAATLEGFDSIGIELTEDYLPIIEGRVAWAQAEVEKARQLTIDEA